MSASKGSIHFEITADNDDLKRKLAESRQAILNSGQTAEAEGSKIEGMFKRAALAAGGFFTVQQALSFGQSIVRVRGEMQMMEKSFEVLLQSKSKAMQMIAEIKQLAIDSPLEMPQVSGAVQTLLGFGVSAEKVMGIVGQLSDVSMGNADRFQSLALVYAQTQAAGKLMGQDLLQMINAGFNPLQVISEQTGKSIAQLKDDMSAGAISAEMVADAFATVTSEGGKFYQMTQKQAEGIVGLQASLEDAITNQMNKFGEKNEELIADGLRFATSVVENYEKVGREIGALVVTYGAYKAAVISFAAVQKTVTTIKHTEEAAELAKLLTIEQQAKISKLGLTKTSSEYAAAVKAEIAANVQAAQSVLAKARAEVTAANQSVVARRGEYVIAKQLEKQRLAELMSIGATGTAKQVETAQRKLSAAEMQRESAALAFQSASRDFNAKKTVVEAAARTASTTATAVNTAAQTANATATGFLSMAKIKLTAITAKLNAAIMNNPYTIAAVAVAALAYGIYKLCTAQSAAEKAQEAFNEKIEDGKKKQDEFVSKTNELIGVIRTETNTRYMQTKAFKELNDKYPDLLKNISMEKLLLMDNLELQKLIAQYKENESKKELFAGLDGATKDLATAKQALDNYVSNNSKGTGGTSILEVWRLNGNIEEAEESLKLWQDKLKEHRQIEADARPVDVKIADLSQNITLLENQLAEVQRLQDEAKKNNPYGWNLYEFQIGAINAQISAKQGELNALNEGNAAQKGQDGNKAYWETQKKNAQDALEAMGEAKKNTKEWNAEVAKINQASSKLKQLDVSGKGDAKDANTLKKLAQEITSNQLKLEDEKIAILEDGRTKRLALSEQELADKKATLKKEYDNTVSEYKKLKKALPEEVTTTYNQRVTVAESAKSTRDAEINKDADKELQEHQKAITDVFLNEESKRLAAIKERYDKEREWADAQFKGGNMTAEQRDNYKSGVDKSQQYEELESLLKEYQTYVDKRKEIEEKFNSEVATLQSKNEGGKYDAQIKQAEKQKKEALSKTDFEEQKKGIDFTQLFGNLDNLTLPSQKELRNKIKAWIDTASKDLSPEDLKAVSDAFNKLDLNIADKDPFSVLKSSISDYKTAVKEVDEAQKVYNETLEKYKKDSDEAKKAAEALTAANNKKAASVEKANEAIHSVADKGQQIVGAATDVMNIMGDLGIKVPEEIAGAIDGVGQMMDGLASIDLTKPLSIVTGGIKMIGGLVKSITSVFNGDNKKEKGIQKTQVEIDKLDKAYQKLEKSIEDAYSSDAAQLIEQGNVLLEQQNEQLEKQKELENSKKKPDTQALDEYNEKIEKNNEEIEENKKKAQDAIFGTDVKSAIDDFASAYMEAWASGEDRAKSQKDVVKNMIRGVINEMVKSNIGKTIGDIRDKIEAAMEGGISAQEEDEIDALVQQAYKENETYTKPLEKWLVDQEDTPERESAARGIATASQESVDENNGRLTTMQEHTNSLNENIKLMTPNVASIKESMDFIRDNAANQLVALHAIRDNTAPIATICTEITAMKNDINTMMVKGVKMI